MTSFNVSRSVLTVGAGLARSYTSATVRATIQEGGSNFTGLPFALKAKYTKTAFIPDVIREGDRITDVYGTVYDVHNVDKITVGDQFQGYQAELFALKTVSLRSRSSLGVYTTTTVYMNLAVSGQAQIQPKQHYGLNDYVGVTAALMKEGDQILDADGKYYTVMSVSEYPSGRNDGFNWTIVALTPRFEACTLGTLTLGATADAITGHYPQTYATSAIYMGISAKGQNQTKLTVGYYNRYDYVGVTDSPVYEGDQITDSNGVLYEVLQMHTYQATRTDYVLKWYVCGLTKRDFAVQPAASGAWHLDSESVRTDPRNRIKTLIDAYLVAANIKQDNGATNATTLTCFDGAYYDIKRLFLTKTLDIVAPISRKTSTVLYTDPFFGHKPYGFQEQVQIETHVVNKSTVTATNLAEQFEQEIRRIFTTYDAYTNVRDLESIAPTMEDLGYGYLCKTAIMIQYKRNNDDYVASYPTITWGPSATPTGTYTWPNVTTFAYKDPDSGDIRILPPGRMGEILQVLGSEDFEFILTSDTSLSPPLKVWKRPQATPGSPTDGVAHQVFNEIKFKGKTDSTMIYQTFNYGAGASIPVRVIAVEVNGETLKVTLKRYSSTDQSTGTHSAYYGTS